MILENFWEHHLRRRPPGDCFCNVVSVSWIDIKQNDVVLTFFPPEKLAIESTSHEERNELIPVWDFKPAWKQVLFTWSFISAAFQNDPIFWWTCVSISFRVVFTWYFITRNEISFLSKWPIWNPLSFKFTCTSNATSNESALIHFVSGKSCSHENPMPVLNFVWVKMTNMKFIPALSFKRTWALNATSNESTLIHFISGKSCSHENLMPAWNFISVKMTDMKSIPFWVSFRLNSCEHNKELTEHRSEIFNRNEISYWFKLM